MSVHDTYVQGDYNAACFECGRKKKASQLKKHWRGYFVCPEHWEGRQPQDFVGTPPTEEQVPWSQPQQDTFVASGVPDFDPYDPTTE